MPPVQPGILPDAAVTARGATAHKSASKPTRSRDSYPRQLCLQIPEGQAKQNLNEVISFGAFDWFFISEVLCVNILAIEGSRKHIGNRDHNTEVRNNLNKLGLIILNVLVRHVIARGYHQALLVVTVTAL